MLDDCWLCEPEDAAAEFWMSDAPWVKANQRLGHISTVRHSEGVAQIFDVIRFVPDCDTLRQLFYGHGNRGEIAGFSARWSTRDPSLAQNAVNVIDAGGRDDLTSVWLVVWGRRSVFFVTPDGRPPIGGGEMGLVVADWRYVVRIANIARGGADLDLKTLFGRAALMVPRLGGSENYRPTFYVSAAVRKQFGADWFGGIFVRTVGLRGDESRVD